MYGDVSIEINQEGVNPSTIYNNQLKAMEELQVKLKNLENAHRRCSQINRHMDSFINTMMLLCSATVACLESISSTGIARSEYTVQISKILLSGFVSMLAAFNQLFSNRAKSETHHTLCRSYMSLGLKMNLYITKHDISKYEEILNEFLNIRQGSIGIFECVRRSYSID